MMSELARDRVKHHDTELKILRIVEELKTNNPQDSDSPDAPNTTQSAFGATNGSAL